jgi:hypothetical protein
MTIPAGLVPPRKAGPIRDDGEERAPSLLPRGVLPAHVLTLVGAGIFLLYEATKQWFDLDEWDFLAYRGVRLGNHGIFYPHNEHWVTIPILVWRGIFSLVGVRDYWLYALPMILAHLAIVYLLWRLMLRHNVEPWTATLLVAAFAVLGVGSEELSRAFQLTFLGSVAFGLLAIDAIERGKLWIPALWGLCALMCSNIGVPMLVGCVLVALVRRRPAAAAIAAVPPALCFVIWYEVIGHAGTRASADLASLSVGGLATYVWTGLTASTGGFVDGSPRLGALIVAVLAGAAVVRRNVPAALALTSVAFYAFVAIGRLQLGTNEAAAPRYSYISIALFLPLIGQLLTMLVRNHDVRPLILSALVVLVGANAVLLESSSSHFAAGLQGERTQVQAAAYLIRKGEHFPGQEVVSSPIGVPDAPDVAALTGWVRRGQFPVPATVTPDALRAERTILGAFTSGTRGYQGDLTFAAAGSPTCVKLNPFKPTVVRLPVSGSLRLVTKHVQGYTVVKVAFLDGKGAPYTPVYFQVIRTQPWLNLPAGTYPVVTLTSSVAVRICEATSSQGSARA